ncbi:hypothetical protein DNTS_034745 [Danionella cerebrum]|uniref:Phospholipid/glycerol acyltransferase domain-containing protein n=1 Tax=Danionella cerebrum TaxID=2873325 RepID=A0A553RJ84_9TELE|nr:hypothetical protein DNTS_034745 [Danionella translucida]
MLNQGAVMIFTGVCGALVVMAVAYYAYWTVLLIMGVLAWLKSQFILQLLIGFVFVVSGLIINFTQLLTCVLWPVDKQLYRRINTRLSYSLWSQLVMLLEWWSGTDCTLYTDQATVDKFGTEHVIIILNHNFEVDFLCGWTMCERYGVLGSSKVLAKHELLKVPLIGWTWYFLEIVFCKRRWEEDRETVFSGLNRLRDYPECMWFLLYCEGTRFTEKKHQISMEVAESKGLPKLKRFSVEEIPDDEKECADWLHKLYQEKDALQEHYEKEGTYPGPTIIPKRRVWTLLNFLFWATLLLSPLISFAWDVFVSGSPLLIIGFMIFLIFVTEVKKTGSSYGNVEAKKQN